MISAPLWSWAATMASCAALRRIMEPCSGNSMRRHPFVRGLCRWCKICRIRLAHANYCSLAVILRFCRCLTHKAGVLFYTCAPVMPLLLASSPLATNFAPLPLLVWSKSLYFSGLVRLLGGKVVRWLLIGIQSILLLLPNNNYPTTPSPNYLAT